MHARTLARTHTRAHAHAAAKAARFADNLGGLRNLATQQRGSGAWGGVPGAPCARLSVYDDDLMGFIDGADGAMAATFGGAEPDAYLFHGRQPRMDVPISRSATKRAAAAAASSDGHVRIGKLCVPVTRLLV
jgi:hypothetical protein